MNPPCIAFRHLRLISRLAGFLALVLAAPFAGSAQAAAAGRPQSVVTVVQRIREGETITKDRLGLMQSTPATPDAGTFSRLGPVVGRVALRDLAEGSVVHRADVGAKPEIQFRTTPTTEVHVRAFRRRGAVRPDAQQDYRQCELDTATLPAPQAATLRKELADSRVLLASPGAFEILQGSYEDYTLAVTLNGVTKSLVWSTDRAPAQARRLVDSYLNACAAPTPR